MGCQQLVKDRVYPVHRYSDPRPGQFLSVDPAVDVTGQPYAYTSGDPVNRTDSTGLATLGFCGDVTGQLPGLPIGGIANACLTRTIDKSGEDDIGLTGTIGGNVGLGADFAVGGAIQVSNATNLHQLQGVFSYVTVGGQIFGGGTAVVFWNASRSIWGIEIGIAAGIGVEGGGGFSYTSVRQFNGIISANIARGIWDLLGGPGAVSIDQLLGRAHSLVRAESESC